MIRARPVITGLALMLGLAVATASATAADDTVARQVSMHLRVLTYDRNMKSRGGKDKVVLGVVYDPASKRSESDARTVGAAFRDAAAGVKLFGRAVEIVLVPWRGDEMAAKLRRRNVVLLYIASNTQKHLSAIKKVAASLRAPTMAGSRALVAAGVGVGVILRDGKARIVINRKACESHGMRLEAKVYKHAELIESSD